MCGCGQDKWCAGGCNCGCDHDSLDGQVRQAQHFARQYDDLRSRQTNARCWCGGRAYGDECLDSNFHDPLATGRPEQIRKLYIAGPMSGYPDNNYPEFHRVANLLEGLGYEVVNPAAVGPEGKSHYVDLLRADLQDMMECDAVATLEHWWESTGARNEIQVAGILKMPVRAWHDWAVRYNPHERIYSA